MKISLSTGSHIEIPFSLRKNFQMAKELNFDGVEFVINDEYVFHKVNFIKKLSKDYNIPILSIHCPIITMPFLWPIKYWVNKTFKIAHELEGKLVVIHPPFMKPYYSKIGLGLLEYLKEKRREYPDIKITLENFRYSRKNKFDNYEKFNKVLEQFNFDLTLDTTHIGFTDYELSYVYNLFKSRIKNIHISDWKTNHEHLTPGTGILPLKELIEDIKKDNYQGFLTLELLFLPWINNRKVFQETNMSSV